MHSILIFGGLYPSCLLIIIILIATIVFITPDLRINTYQHTWFCLFLFHCRTNHIHSCLFKVFFHQSFFLISPPGSCLPFFTFLSSFTSTTLPGFLQPACFSACLCSVWPLFLCGCTGELDWRGACVCQQTQPHTIPQHHTQTQTTSMSSRPSPAAQGRVKGQGSYSFFSPFTPRSRGYYWLLLLVRPSTKTVSWWTNVAIRIMSKSRRQGNDGQGRMQSTQDHSILPVLYLIV
jgi:hypothetical protein